MYLIDYPNPVRIQLENTPATIHAYMNVLSTELGDLSVPVSHDPRIGTGVKLYALTLGQILAVLGVKHWHSLSEALECAPSALGW